MNWCQSFHLCLDPCIMSSAIVCKVCSKEIPVKFMSFNLSQDLRPEHCPEHWAVKISYFLCRCQNITYPLNLPQVSIVFIFVNEALSVILRSIHSAINRTPSHLLKEIILVDDNSNNSKEHIFYNKPISQSSYAFATAARRNKLWTSQCSIIRKLFAVFKKILYTLGLLYILAFGTDEGFA